MYKALQQQVQSHMLAIVLIALFLMTLAAGYLYLLKVPLKEFHQSRQTLSLLEDEVQTGIPLQNQITNQQRQIEQLEIQLHGTGPQLPDSQMIAFVIGQLDKIAGQHDVTLVSVQPGLAETIFTFRELPFQMQLKGSYFSLFNWLFQVEKELGPVVIKQFEINADSNSNNRNISLVIASYQFIEK
jgi:Tfp pilus assembly protein PilO